MDSAGDLLSYAASIGWKWWILLGVLETALGALSRFSGWRVPLRAYVFLLLMFMTVSGFLAWRDVKSQLDQYKGIRAEIRGEFWGSTADDSAVISLEVTLKNRGLPTALDHWRLSVVQPRHTFEGRLVGDPSAERPILLHGTENKGQPVRVTPDMWLPALLDSPIAQGGKINGLVSFTFPGILREQLLDKTSKLEFSFDDTYGNKYPIAWSAEEGVMKPFPPCVTCD